MAAYGRTQSPQELMNPVRPRAGFPVQNQGGLPQAPTVAPPKPFVTSPTLGAQPGPNAIPRLPVPAPVVAPASPAPAPPAPTAPSTAPAPAPAPASTSTSSTTSSSGQTGAISPSAQGNLEGQLQSFISQGLGGNTVSQDFINRAKGGVARNVWGQQRAGEQAINDDAVRRGLFRSGIPAESIAGLRGKSQGAIASGVADILNSAEAQNIQGKQNAAGMGSNLLGMNRSWEQYQNQRADEAAARAAAGKGGKPTTFDYVDPDTGQVYQMDEAWF